MESLDWALLIMKVIIRNSFFVTFCLYWERREILYWDKWLGGGLVDWGIGPLSGVQMSPWWHLLPPISRIAFCQMNPACKSTSGGRQCKYIWFIGGEKWFLGVAGICQPGKSSVPPKPKDGPTDKRGRIWTTMLVFIWSEFGLVSRILQNLRRKWVQILLEHSLFSIGFKISPPNQKFPH